MLQEGVVVRLVGLMVLEGVMMLEGVTVLEGVVGLAGLVVGVVKQGKMGVEAVVSSFGGAARLVDRVVGEYETAQVVVGRQLRSASKRMGGSRMRHIGVWRRGRAS